MHCIPKEFRLESAQKSECYGFVARKFYFSPDTFSVQTIKELESLWENIPNPLAQKAIAIEHQYYLFHRFLLNAIQHKYDDGYKGIPMGLSVRVGAIKAARLIVGSITEAALRAHAEARGLGMPKDEKKKTLGKILTACEEQSDMADILNLARKVHYARNDVHLYKSLNRERDFAKYLTFEPKIHADDENLLLKLRGLISF